MQGGKEKGENWQAARSKKPGRNGNFLQVVITGSLSRRALEAFKLELGRLAKAQKVQTSEFRIEPLVEVRGRRANRRSG